MPNEIQPFGQSSPFDAIRQVREDGSEYWRARELMPLQGYGKWERFARAIDRAKIAAANTGVDVDAAFVQIDDLPASGKNPSDVGGRPSTDYHLSRFACYLVGVGK